MREVPPTLEIGAPQPLEIMEPKIQQPSTLSTLTKIKEFLSNITVEPILLLLIAPRYLCSITNDNLNLEKACYVNSGYNQSVCHAMILRDQSGYTPHQEDEVQKVVSTSIPYKQACHFIQSITLLLVSGWSDRTQKRKPMFYLPFIGDMSALVGYAICVYFFMDLSAQYSTFIEGILTIAFGGMQLLLAGSYSYVAIITDDKSRTVRVGAVAIMTRASMTIGIALSGYGFRYFGYYGVYSVAFVMNLIGVIYTLTIIKNVAPKENEKKDDSEYSCCYHVFEGTFDSFAKCMRICFKKGPNKRRTKMIVSQSLNYMGFGISIAEFTVTYLFVRKKFTWDEVDYSIYKAFRTIVEVAGCTFGSAYFSKYSHWSDATIGIISVISKMLGTLFLAFCRNGLEFYLATLHDFFAALMIISIRSLITKTVNQNEQGLANSMTSVVDSVGLFSIGPLFAFIYYNTVAFFPGAFYLFSTLCNIPILILFCVSYKSMDHQKR